MNIVIFGATSGIGKELAKMYVAAGHQVLITGRRIEKLQKIQQSNPKQYYIKQHDVTDIPSTDLVFKELIKLGWKPTLKPTEWIDIKIAVDYTNKVVDNAPK